MFFKLPCIFKNIKFRPPEKNSVVIFDREGSSILQKAVLEGVKHTVFPVRHEEFYFSFRLCLLFLKNLFVLSCNYKRKTSFYLIYIFSCLEYIGPKVVLTFIDNNVLFHEVSNLYHHADFYAIQNGIRNTKHNIKGALLQSYGHTNQYRIQNFLCFGEHEKEIYAEYGHSIRKFHPVGSLVGGYYRSCAGNAQEKPEFDLCLISQWKRNVMLNGEYPGLKKAIVSISEFLSRFVKTSGVSICIATGSNDIDEIAYFRSLFDDKAKIIEFNKDKFSTYLAVDMSRVVVTFCSTVGYEAFGWGKKILFCNFSDDRWRNFPIDGFWSLNKDDYSEFYDKLTYLLSMPEADYRHRTEVAARYVINYNPSLPAHLYLRNLVIERLNKNHA